MEYDADKAEEAGEPNNWLVSSLARWLIGLPARQLIGSLTHRLVDLLDSQSTLLNKCWEEDEDPSPQHGTNGVRCR